MRNDDRPRNYRQDTLLTHVGRNPEANHGVVNPPVYHASTILSKNMAEWEAKRAAPPFSGVRYGLHGTPGTFALEELLAKIEGGYRTMLVSSGLAAVTAPLQALLGAGDHCLMVDSAYGPARNFCDGILKRCGVETTYYDPLIGEGIEKLFRPNTKVLYCESPGSLTFEVQDIPAMAAIAHKYGAKVLMDNTWGTPYLFRSFEHGVDISIHAATKYICGHSDAMLGAIIMNEETFLPVRSAMAQIGHSAAPDDVFFALRGMRTLSVRLERHQKNAMEVARWLQARPEVSRVLYPALPQDPGHQIWKRDFLGACGLFGFVLNPVSKEALHAFIDSLDLFGIGASWGGFESLIQPAAPPRTAQRWQAEGPLVRVHIGLEDPQDLIADLARGLEHLKLREAAQ
ncbi:MAG: cystathionine beta-lyase [Alphaproteobacteria bacterium]|nr:cystathionine beta-lyase [Alphaproteobacteria bacterium]